MGAESEPDRRFRQTIAAHWPWLCDVFRSRTRRPTCKCVPGNLGGRAPMALRLSAQPDGPILNAGLPRRLANRCKHADVAKRLLFLVTQQPDCTFVDPNAPLEGWSMSLCEILQRRFYNYYHSDQRRLISGACINPQHARISIEINCMTRVTTVTRSSSCIAVELTSWLTSL